MTEISNVSSSSGRFNEIVGKMDSLSIELRRLGLTDYEARCYLAAIAVIGGRAEEIAEMAVIPRTSAYKALESLIQRGFIEQSKDRPRRFNPIDPMVLKERLTGDIESTFEKIIELQEDLAHKGSPQVFYMMNGEEIVLRRIGDMIERAENRLIISSPNISLIRKKHGKAFEKALKKNVKISVIAPPFVKLPPCTSSVRRRNLIATDVVMDGEEALIASADISACGFTDNVLIAVHLENFLEIAMRQEIKEDTN